jgi:iron complex outermembrane receptor protein
MNGNPILLTWTMLASRIGQGLHLLISMGKAPLAFLVASLSVCQASQAAEPSQPANQKEPQAKSKLEELLKLEVPTVYGASKVEQKTTEAPSSVTIISSDEIKKYGYRTLADVLASTQGFYVTYDRNNDFVGVRGINRGLYPNSRLLVLVDGHRINNNLYDGALVGTESVVDVDLIDRVEVIRGPGSVLYGNNAFFGVVNVITRRGRDLRGPEVSSEGGSFNTFKERFTYGNKLQNDVEVFLSGAWFRSQGPQMLFYKEFNQATNNNGIAQGLDFDSRRSFFGKLAYHDFALEGAWLAREKGNPTAQFTNTVFNDPRFQTVDERSFMNLRYSHEFPSVADVTSRIYYDRGDFDTTVPSAIPDGRGGVIRSINREVNQGEWWGAEVQLQRTLFDRHIVTLGGEYRDDFRQKRANYDANTGASTGTAKSGNRQNFGVFAQGDFTLHPTLHLNTGIRYDQYSGFAAEFNPRHALIYNPSGSSVFKIIFGTAFRAPTFIESFNSLSGSLRPETITGYELAYEQGIGSHLRSTLSFFRNRTEDLIIFDSTGKYSNADSATSRGLEAGLEGFWASGLRGRASYSFQEAKDAATNGRLTDSPRHIAKVNLSVPVIRDRLFAGLEWQYTSSRLTFVGTEAPGFGIVNATLFSQRLTPGLELSASVYNLFDRQYGDPATPLHVQDVLPRDGRSVRVTLSYRF